MIIEKIVKIIKSFWALIELKRGIIVEIIPDEEG
jgi:hypothetical protein